MKAVKARRWTRWVVWKWSSAISLRPHLSSCKCSTTTNVLKFEPLTTPISFSRSHDRCITILQLFKDHRTPSKTSPTLPLPAMPPQTHCSTSCTSAWTYPPNTPDQHVPTATFIHKISPHSVQESHHRHHHIRQPGCWLCIRDRYSILNPRSGPSNPPPPLPRRGRLPPCRQRHAPHPSKVQSTPT